MGTRQDSRWTGRNLVHCAIRRPSASSPPLLSFLPYGTFALNIHSGPLCPREQGYAPSNLPGLCIRWGSEDIRGRKFLLFCLIFRCLAIPPSITPSFLLPSTFRGAQVCLDCADLSTDLPCEIIRVCVCVQTASKKSTAAHALNEPSLSTFAQVACLSARKKKKVSATAHSFVSCVPESKFQPYF